MLLGYELLPNGWKTSSLTYSKVEGVGKFGL